VDRLTFEIFGRSIKKVGANRLAVVYSE